MYLFIVDYLMLQAVNLSWKTFYRMPRTSVSVLIRKYSPNLLLLLLLRYNG